MPTECTLSIDEKHSCDAELSPNIDLERADDGDRAGDVGVKDHNGDHEVTSNVAPNPEETNTATSKFYDVVRWY